MEDEQILDLFFDRDEAAITETKEKYGRYLTKIAYQILGNYEDSEESVNDTYFRAWNAIPPNRPGMLVTYLAKITRRLSIDGYRRKNSSKRGGSEYTLSLEELSECVSGRESPEQEMEYAQLGHSISTYLRTLPQENRTVFLGRYFFCDSIQTIGEYMHFSESKVKSMLHRTRKGLRVHLEKEGYVI